MALVLVMLAIGSVVAGYVGVPAALGGNNWIEHYLHPSFVAHGSEASTGNADRSSSHGRVPSQPATGEHGAAPDALKPESARACGTAHDDVALERSLMLVSSIVAFAGIGLAWYFFARRPAAADAVAAAPRRCIGCCCTSTYVDEIYDAAIVQPIKRLSTGLLWKGVDAGVIDGAVNGTGAFVGAGSSVLRRLQTGSVRAYAVSVFLGVVVMLGYYMWRF